MSTLLNAALELAEAGFSVLPIEAQGKRPLVKWEELQRRRAGPSEIEAWFAQWPDARLGLVTGAISGVDVLDIDPGAQWQEGVELPTGLVVETPRQGRHHYLAHVVGLRNSASALAHKVDVRADGGYVLCPPSAGYRILYGSWDEARTPAPSALLKRLALLSVGKAAPEKPDAWADKLIHGVSEGARNAAAAQLAGRYLALGLSRDETLVMLRTWNGQNSPPLANEELEAVITSIARKELLKRGETGGQAGISHEDVCRAFSEATGVPIDKMRILGGQESTFEFIIHGRPYYLPAGSLAQQNVWRREMIGAAHICARPVDKKPGWEHWMNLLMSTAEVVEAGDDAYLSGHIGALIADYLSTHRPAEESQIRGLRQPVRKDGDVWFSVTAFRVWLRTCSEVRFDHTRLLQLLSSIGYERRVLSVKIAEDKRSTVVMYKIPPYVLSGLPRSSDSVYNSTPSTGTF